MQSIVLYSRLIIHMKYDDAFSSEGEKKMKRN